MKPKRHSPFNLIPDPVEWTAPGLNNLKADERLKQLANELTELRSDFHAVLQILAKSECSKTSVCRCVYSGALVPANEIIGFSGVWEGAIEDAYWDEDFPQDDSEKALEMFHYSIGEHFCCRWLYGNKREECNLADLRKTPLGRVVLEMGFKPGAKFSDMPNFVKFTPHHIRRN